MVTRARLRMLRTLRRKQARAAEGVYLVEGTRLVREAIRSGAPVEELLATEAYLEADASRDLLEAAAAADLAPIRVGASDLGRVAATKTPQGVVAVVRRTPVAKEALEGDGLVLVLDGVADPGNVGTLVRVADAFAARAVVAGPGTADFENEKVLRAAMGSTFHLPCARRADLPGFLAGARAEGATVAATVLDGDDVHGVSDPGRRCLVVLGNEARGVSPEVRANADLAITVPCPGRAESLNVAMAGAIVVATLARARARAGGGGA